MSFLIAAAAALAALYPVARAQPGLAQGSESDALRLLPAESQVLVRLQSIDALLELVNRFGAVSGAPAFTATELLEDLNVPGDASQIDSSRALWLAFSQTPAPAVTFAVPARDAAALIAALELGGQAKTLASGGYVGISNGGGLELHAEPPALAAKMRPGLVSVHVDLATLIEAYRPFIEMGLEQVETQLDSEASQAAPGAPDMAPMIEAYVDFAWDFFDSAEHLDLVLAQQGASLELQSTLSTLEGSPLAGWGTGPAVQLGAWPAQIDPKSTLSMAFAGDWASLMKRMQPMTEASLGVYPQVMQSFLREYISAVEGMYGLMGPVFAGGDLSAGGMRMGYLVASEKPQELASAMTALSQRLPQGDDGFGVSLTPPEPVELGPVKAQRMRLQIDAAALGRSLGQAVSEADQIELDQGMKALFGPDGLDFTLAVHPKSVALAMGGDDDFARSVLSERSAAGSSVPLDLQRALAAVEGSNTALVYRFDMGRLTAQLSDLADALGQSSVELAMLPKESLPMCVWGSIRGPVWSSGIQVELESLLAFVNAAAQAQPDVGEDEELSQAMAQMHLTMIAGALELYAVQHDGSYPESLSVLVERDASGESFLAELPLDPWKNPYVYEPPPGPEQAFKLISYGADGAPGGAGIVADIDYASLRAGR